ncbi:alkaline phosphatase D family protein [Tundrisphaera sp. TA3]|uniref:alkaline phosphatase D family protein n=1 Tax=Tundrisphaera sp. TA3 TaxID=3435775 RepID=UPI003EB9361E
MLDLTAIHESVRKEGRIGRRAFLAQASALAALPWLAGRVQGSVLRAPSFASDPFTLGVASGDPDNTGFVLWTRLAPSPLEPGGGMPAAPVAVSWEIAEDEAMKGVVRSGTALATPQLGHSVHVEVEGLKPDRWYWYRFRSGDAETPIARTRTLPEPSALPDKLRFAFASCQHYESGLFTAYQHMAKDELDLVVHLGDYIYEGGPGKNSKLRTHSGTKEIESLEEYRARHAQYKTDPLLRAVHAQCPWLVTWDDHEVENNYAGTIPQDLKEDPVAWLARRANAYQAYYEAMPLRRRSLPRGPEMQLYRKATYGRLAEFLVLDTRQYRTDQPNNDTKVDLNAAALDPRNTLLGAKQNGWLKASLLQSQSNWNVLAQQVMMGLVDRTPGDERHFSMDQWPSAYHERMELMRWIAERKVPNPVVLTGDIHSNWVNDLRVDDRRAEDPVVATEFVGTSISSGGNGSQNLKAAETLRAENPCVKFFNAQRGYVRCTVTPASWQSDYVVVEDVTKPDQPAVLRASFAVESGKPGAQTA